MMINCFVKYEFSSFRQTNDVMFDVTARMRSNTGHLCGDKDRGQRHSGSRGNLKRIYSVCSSICYYTFNSYDSYTFPTIDDITFTVYLLCSFSSLLLNSCVENGLDYVC